MKKFIIILLGVIVVFLVMAYVKLFTKQTSYQKTIAASSSSVLVLENFDNAKVKIVTGKDEEIKFDLTGPTEDILSIIKAEAGIYTTVEFTEGLSDVSGTITVPEGIILDISLSEERLVKVDDIDGQKRIPGEDSFLVDTNNMTSLIVDDSGDVSLNAFGDLTVWDDESWDPLDDNGGTDDIETIVYCGIGSQAIRNYCCEQENADEQATLCDGLGYWFFNNSERACDYACESLGEQGEGESEELLDCSIGAQDERDACCASQHVGEYQGCIGSWRYSAAAQECIFACYDMDDPLEEPLEESGDSGGGSFSYGDPVSDYCVDIMNAEDRDLCCDDALKNPLSSGPRPGFPDCIGKWEFDVQQGCHFECAEHAEMMEILGELRQQAQEQ